MLTVLRTMFILSSVQKQVRRDARDSLLTFCKLEESPGSQKQVSLRTLRHPKGNKMTIRDKVTLQQATMRKKHLNIKSVQTLSPRDFTAASEISAFTTQSEISNACVGEKMHFI